MQFKSSGAVRTSFVGADAHIGPRRMQHFYGNPRRIRNFSLDRQSRRPLCQGFTLPRISVVADDSVRPQDAPLFTGICDESVTSQRADVGIGPYSVLANPYCPANFERKAFLPQILNCSYLQIRCPATGGAYHSARRVARCVRNDYKSGLA